ncbi:hypothetical protein SKAU_G00393960 [Synaphobranchus kaupii]|uniref:Uncharacterized protein n=1 Tax=Synaphobranchus kaupii TaxID=118154 RepID=A0A9Q1EC25_SYNKA|nr:hypothetical protein SKAU_G00393960 [Synaphobranchus kaupii]
MSSCSLRHRQHLGAEGRRVNGRESATPADPSRTFDSGSHPSSLPLPPSPGERAPHSQNHCTGAGTSQDPIFLVYSYSSTEARRP